MNDSSTLKKQLLYNLFLGAALTVGLPIWTVSLIQAKRRPTIAGRLGLGQPPTVHAENQARPIWVHALSVGEVQSAEPLLRALSLQGLAPLVFSASTRTGFETAQRLYGQIAERIFYFPFDLPFSVKKVLDAVDPRQVILVETDIWPNFLFEIQKRRIPAVLVNARMSERSAKRYRKARWLLAPALRAFDAICTQSQEGAERFAGLGYPTQRITVTGSIKFDQPLEENSLQAGLSVRNALRLPPDQLILVAGSTHTGEDDLIVQAYAHLRQHHPNLTLMVVPRHPQRASAVAGVVERHGLSWTYLSGLSLSLAPKPGTVWVVNTIGMLRTLYSAADIAFVGGSLVPEGGHNPLEPAAWAKPILFGPHMQDCADAADRLVEQGGARKVADGVDLTATLGQLLSDPKLRDQMGQAAQAVLRANQGAVHRTLNTIGLST